MLAWLLPGCVLKALKVLKVLQVRRVEIVCIEEDTLIFEDLIVEDLIVEDNGMLDDVDKRARTPRQPTPLAAKTGSIRSSV